MEKINSFKDLNLKPAIQKALANNKYTVPTPIQSQAIPNLLKGNDLIGIAQTGTGKTASFILPILERMKEEYPRKIKTLVLAPTRELAIQIGEGFSKYGEFLKFKHTVIYGGVNQVRQVKALNRGADIVVATPGRLLDLLTQKKLSLKDIEYFVLDEADMMLDMGFIHDLKKIIARLPNKRQSLFFSATMSPKINELAKSLLKNNPVHIEITPQATTVESIDQYVFFVDQNYKEKLLLKLLKHEHLTSILVFTRTKHRANKVSEFLNKNKISSDAVHGNKAQNARSKIIRNFKEGKIKVLVATDVAARGIDIKNISHVVNFELPNEPETYVHRIGRTARAGKQGSAYSFCAAQERSFLRDIEKLIKQEIRVMDHSFHSETARKATGAASRPEPRRSSNRGLANRSSGNSKGSLNRSSNSRDKFKSASRTRRSFSKDDRSSNRPRSSSSKNDKFGNRSRGAPRSSSRRRPSRR